MKNLIIGGIIMLGTIIGCAAEPQTDVFKTKGGKDVTITAIKHATMRIQYDGQEIHVDPVGMKMDPATDYSKFKKADLIFVTHEHFDHYDKDAIELLKKEGTQIYLNPAVKKLYGSGTALTNGETKVISKEIKVEAVPAYNTTKGRDKFHPKGRDNGYILTIDGLRIYIAGDTEPIPEMKDIKDIDIAFLPVNQPYTMTTEQLVKAARTIRPKVLFPYHYGQTDVSGIPAQLKEDGIEVRIRHYE